MPDLPEPSIVRFNDILLDRQAGKVYRIRADGRKTTVRIGARALQILCLLLDRRGETVSPHEIMATVWPDVTVEPNNLTVQIAGLRRALDGDASQAGCILNVPRRGYRFAAPVTEISPYATDDAATKIDKTSDVLLLQAEPEHLCARAEAIPAAEPRALIRPRRGHLVWVVALCLSFAALVAAGIWSLDHPATPTGERDAFSSPSAPMQNTSMERPRLSVVVLPFTNLGGNGLTDGAVDAISDDLTTSLAHQPDIVVTARNSAFTYKGKPIDIKRVGDDLGVRYAAEGSVRKVDGKLRVNVQLVSTDTGGHLWADRFESSPDGAGYGVDEIVRDIARALNLSLIDAEAARGLRERPGNPDVADLLLRARSLHNRPQTPQRQAELVPLYERILELDPNSAIALAGLAEALLDSFYHAEDPTFPDKLRRAEALLKQAEFLRPNIWMVKWTRVYLLGHQNRCQELIPAAQQAVEAHPGLSGVRQWMGICQLRMGRAAEAIESFQQAIRVNTRNTQNFIRYRLMGFGFLRLDRYDDAVQWFHRYLAANPIDSAGNRSNVHAAIAAAHALAGRMEAASSSAAEAAKLNPMLTVRSYYPYNLASTGAALAQVARMSDGMRLAGIRDHAAEDADFGVVSNDVLHTDYVAPTPTTVPGAQTIRTPDLARLLELAQPLVLDTTPWGRSIPGAIGLWGAGVGGSVSDSIQERLGRKMQQLGGGDRSRPVVAMGFNSERYQGRNLALRLVALGYTEVYWYRGGREAWQVAGLPDAELILQDW